MFVPPATPVLTFDYEVGWVFFSGSKDRTFSVVIEPAGGGNALRATTLLTATAGTVTYDTGVLQGAVDLSAYAGQIVRVCFDSYIPESYTGPGFLMLDNVDFSNEGGAAPSLFAQPGSLTVAAGQTATFRVSAGGTPPLFYQWQKNDLDLAGATNSILTLSNVTVAEAGNYRVVVTNAYGAATSSVAVLTIGLPPVIVSQPASRSASDGETVVFSVSAEGTAPLSYQWQRNGSDLPGANGPTLTLSEVTFADAANYTVVIQNEFGSITSSTATLSISNEQIFRILTLQTNGVIAREHESLTGDDRGGVAVSTRLFYTGDNNDSTTYRFDIGTMANGASVGRGYDGLVGDLRTETVYALASGNDFIMYTNYTLNFTSVDTLHELDGDTGELTGRRITLSTSIPISYGSGIFAGYGRIVIHNGSEVFNIDLPTGQVRSLGQMNQIARQSSESWAYWGVAEYFDGAVHLVRARNTQAISRTRVPDGLTTDLLITSSYPSLGDLASMTFSPSRSRWYFHMESYSVFHPSGIYGEIVGSAKASYTTESGFPVITQQPQSLVSYPQENVTFEVRAGGEPPLLYQWFHDDAPIAGATNNTLLLSNLTMDQAGSYSGRGQQPARVCAQYPGHPDHVRRAADYLPVRRHIGAGRHQRHLLRRDQWRAAAFLPVVEGRGSPRRRHQPIPQLGQRSASRHGHLQPDRLQPLRRGHQRGYQADRDRDRRRRFCLPN